MSARDKIKDIKKMSLEEILKFAMMNFGVRQTVNASNQMGFTYTKRKLERELNVR
jgi:hypothetical protein